MQKAIIFDLDGTLVDTLEDLSDATNYALEMTGNPKVPLEAMRKFVGDGVVNLVYSALGPNNHTDIKLAGRFFIEHYLSHLTCKSKAYEGINELIYKLKKNNFKLAVVTNKRHSAATIIINHLFPNQFGYVLGESKKIPRKPAPDMIEMAIKELNVTKENAIYVGDSEIDYHAYTAAGLTGITCLYGFSDKQHLLALNPKHIVFSATELFEKIMEIITN